MKNAVIQAPSYLSYDLIFPATPPANANKAARPPGTNELCPLSQDQAIQAMRLAKQRDELLMGLLRGAYAFLEEVQLYVIRAEVLCGFLAVDRGRLDREEVRGRILSLYVPSAACRVVRDGFLHLGPLAKEDAVIDFFRDRTAASGNLLIQPIVVRQKAACVLIGLPRHSCQEDVLNAIPRLAEEASAGLYRLILGHRSSSPQPAEVTCERQENSAVIEEQQEPAACLSAGERAAFASLAATARASRESSSAGSLKEAISLHLKKISQLHRKEPPAVTHLPLATVASASDEGEQDAADLETIWIEAEPASVAIAEAAPKKGVAPLRYPHQIRINFDSQDNFYTGFCEEVSEVGLFVATHATGELGQRYHLSFSMPGLNGICCATGEVQWVREYNPTAADGVPGMGLMFRELSQEAKRAIGSFIKQRQPIFFE